MITRAKTRGEYIDKIREFRKNEGEFPLPPEGLTLDMLLDGVDPDHQPLKNKKTEETAT